jgi:FAD/FMN-containing dehydrogenase/Fe-S oxidoreductase
MAAAVLPHHLIRDLRREFKGDIFSDEATLILYATDASAYREKPLLVVRPLDADDLKVLIRFAHKTGVPLVPRTAGTSLAGQVVGGGIIADVSKHMTRILEINEKERWVRVEPGVVLDELNKILEPLGLFFGPETSTSNRCMIGGMVGNNSCGSHSLVYGSTRDHLLEVHAFLSDGSEVVFGTLTREEYDEKRQLNTLEGELYRSIHALLSDPVNQAEIEAQYPDKALHRRNTGYAIDLLLDCEPFRSGGEAFNFCKLLAGSEGTLCFMTEIRLNLVPLPPKEKALICVHCHTLDEAFRGNIIALDFQPVAIELMDQVILEQTKANIAQRKNRFFLQGDPAAVLIIELAESSREEIDRKADEIIHALQHAGYGYHFPLVYNKDVAKVWSLRKAGLGVLSNVPGDAKPVAVIEDTAVSPLVLPDYMNDFRQMLAGLKLDCVYYAHIATGELHLRPVLNLKDPKDVELFHRVAFETARLVKKYKGSLSGEHGDGRLRGEFIPMMIGDHNYSLLKQIKAVWDPKGIFNPGKITDTPAMNSSLRYDPQLNPAEPETYFDFSATRGILRAAEQCNGSADCRKSAVIGGTMCPSYMATHDENATTRARANMLREFLTRSTKKNRFDHEEIYTAMDLCLSCKGCKSECPSNVDMARYKAEFLQHWYDAHPVPLRTRIIANISRLNRLGMLVPGIFNFMVSNGFISGLMKRSLGFAPDRSIPRLAKKSLRSYAKSAGTAHKPEFSRKVYLFADEFTDYNDTGIGIKAMKLLNRLGYEVVIPAHAESGRAYLSKGFVRKAQALARENIRILSPLISENTPLIGIEPSAILSFRDEYPDLAGEALREKALALAPHCLMFDEFIMREAAAGRIPAGIFTDQARKIRLHGHCHQKSLASTGPTREMLSLPENYTVTEIPSGCCGMAGSFGYEKEHYDLSVKVGELVLFPEVRKAQTDELIAAPGTSCRHQIFDGTGRRAYHPVEILYDALIESSL